MTFGEKIRKARDEAKLSQRDMADKIPMNQSNYSKLERNMQEPSLSQLRRLCEILSLDPHYLLGLPVSPAAADPRYGELKADLAALLAKYETK